MKKSLVAYAVLNVIGLFLFFYLVARVSALAKQEERAYYDGVDGVTFTCTAGPVLLAYLLLNLGWGIKAFSDIFRRRDYRASAALVMAVTAWVALSLIIRFWVTPLHPSSLPDGKVSSTQQY